MTFIVDTNVLASRPPERQPTGMPHARAKIAYKKKKTNGKQYAGVLVGEVHFIFYCIF